VIVFQGRGGERAQTTFTIIEIQGGGNQKANGYRLKITISFTDRTVMVSVEDGVSIRLRTDAFAWSRESPALPEETGTV